jgi:hypothetical membrane protein
MLEGRTAGWIGVATPVWFLLAYVALSAIHPGYSHLTKAVSELGAWGEPYMWWWNILGYGASGLAIALLGVHLRGAFVRHGRVVSYALVASGLLMALSGAFPGNFDDRHAPSMIAHLVSSVGSYVAFVVAGFALPLAVRSSPHWPRIAWPSLAIVLLSLATGALRSGEAPGLGQRLTFACYFLWVALVGVALARACAARPPNNSSKPTPLRGAA